MGEHTTILQIFGFSDNETYKAFKFNGGEVHFKFKDMDFYQSLLESRIVKINTRVHNSDEFMLLMLVVDMIRKDGYSGKIHVFIPYLPYMQADRDFSVGETFSLKTMSKLMRVMDVDKWVVFDAHSDVSQMVVDNISVEQPFSVVTEILSTLDTSNLAIMSPDNGGYKRVKKIVDKIGWEGNFFTANKDRNITSNNIDDISFNIDDFNGQDILVIDDICIGGRTFIELAKKLKERNVGKLYLYCSHGIFSHGIDCILEYYELIHTTNSRDNYMEYFVNDNLKVYDIFGSF